MNNLLAQLQQLDISLPTGTLEQCSAYLDLLQKWNRVYNLTAINDLDQIQNLHFLDSLAVLPFLAGKTALDVGSGAGFPGIVLAMALPDVDFVLLDSNGKKTRFLQQVVSELSLTNVTVVKSRIEEYRPRTTFATVISRAFASLAEFVTLAQPLCDQDGQIMAMKGRYPQAELEALHTSLDLAPDCVTVQRLRLPGVMAERHLVICRRSV